MGRIGGIGDGWKSPCRFAASPFSKGDKKPSFRDGDGSEADGRNAPGPLDNPIPKRAQGS